MADFLRYAPIQGLEFSTIVVLFALPTHTDSTADPTASSSTYAYGGADLSYQGNSHLKAIDLMADIPVQSSISADPVLTPGLGLLGDCGQYQNCVHPTSFNTDFNMNSSSGQASNLSVVSPAESNYSALPSRSLTSLRSEPSDNNAVAAATLILRQKSVRSKQDRTRDSAQSTSSYNSMNSDMSTRRSSKYSSASSVGGQSVSSLRKPSQKPMHLSVKKLHSRSSSTSRASNSIPSSDIPCTDPGCPKTFTRDPDRIRHESAFHENKVVYTCLLHTCAASCSEPCTNKTHSSPYSNSRPDKMKEHLEKVHGSRLKQSEIPKEFLNSYEWQQRGWVCSSCGEYIGSWHDNRDNIAAHYLFCAAGLQASFKRMSVEVGVDGAGKGEDTEKRWPLLRGQEDQSCNWL